jgi:hypothetical protein
MVAKSMHYDIRISINFGMIYFIYALTLIGMSLENKKNAHI